MRLDFAALSDPIQKNVGTLGTLGTPHEYWASHVPKAGDSLGTLGTNPAFRPAPQSRGRVFVPKCPQNFLANGDGSKPHEYCLSPMSPMSPRINTRTRLTEAFEERAAIMEFDGGLFRAEAERLAAESLGVGA